MEAIENPHVATAVRMIREHLGEPFGVELFDKDLLVSRRYLYYHFMRCLNCTPYQYINRARIERAKQLLAAPKNSSCSRSPGLADSARSHVFGWYFGVSWAWTRPRIAAPLPSVDEPGNIEFQRRSKSTIL